MSRCSPKQYILSRRKVDVKDLSNYATKSDVRKKLVLIHIIHKKIDLVSLKFDVDKLNIGKSKTVPNCLKNLKADVHELNVTKLQFIPVDL